MISLEFLESVGSTMDVARERVLAGRILFGEGASDLTGIVAREQTTGRGQRGREWVARPGESLCATYCFPVPPGQIGALSFAAGVGVAEALQTWIATAQGAVRVGLKWPNDVLLNGRKVCGVLVETAQRLGDGGIALVGVGMNLGVVEFPPDVEPFATSLTREGLAAPDWKGAASLVGTHLFRTVALLESGFAPVLERWRAFDETLGRRYETVAGDKFQTGTAVGVADDGALLLHLDSGETLCVLSATSLREVNGA